MDYEKKYNNALDRARLAIKDCGDNQGRKNMIYAIFPELKGSEDERLRRRIKLCLEESVHAGTIRDYEAEEVIAWIEKHKEQDKKSSTESCLVEESEYDKGYRDGHTFGLEQTEDYRLEFGGTFKGLIPCWVNAPSTRQAASKYHAKNLVVMHENNGGFRCICIDDDNPITFHLPEGTCFVEGWRNKNKSWRPTAKQMEELRNVAAGDSYEMNTIGSLCNDLEKL